MASGVGVVVVAAGEGVRGRIRQWADNSRQKRMEEGGGGGGGDHEIDPSGRLFFKH
jgi:hypothetical protein